jgi:copper homeostasis protein
MSYIIEIATSDFATTQMAVKGGADRIELCCNLGEGGTTPSYGVMRQCRERFDTAIFPIIRPRPGDFLYTDDEFACMMHDVKVAKELGFDGVVAGILLKDGSIDTVRMARLVNAAYPMSVTFHRAFDRCKEPLAALESIIETGCERILTSGQQMKAPDGVALIGQLNEIAAGRIVIMPGSGVRADNVAQLAAQTGCLEFHASLRAVQKSHMEFTPEAFAGDPDSYEQPGLAVNDIHAMREALKSQAG